MSKIHSIAVVGLGYVGLPLAVLAAKKKFSVFGLDIDQHKIDSLVDKKSYIDDIPDQAITTSGATFSRDLSLVKKAEAVIVCVPTPVDHDKQPDLTPLKMAVTAIAPFLQNGTLIVIESTVNPGVCNSLIIPLIEGLTNKKVGTDIYLAHCPERINPGDPKWNISNINRVIGADSPHELEIATGLYRQLIDAEIKPMGNLKEAEAVKIVENSFRDINIAFVNELAMSFHKLGINVENVIDGAATKPFAFMAHRPGAGVGGHCIPVDPYYLIGYAHSHGFEHEFLQLARDINDGMPQFTINLLVEALNSIELPLSGTKVALLGLSYKANVSDIRESPSYIIKKLLQDSDVDLTTYDPYVPYDSTAKTLKQALKNATAVVIATNHTEFKDQLTPKLLGDMGIRVVIDGKNMLRWSIKELADAHIIYQGIGI